MSTIKLGELIYKAEQRDAVHVAVAPVVAGEDIRPGTPIGLRTDGYAIAMQVIHALGVADPFLNTAIREGDQFWMLLYPGTIQNLRHHWDHPGLTAHAVGMALQNTPPAEPYDNECRDMGCNEIGSFV